MHVTSDDIFVYSHVTLQRKVHSNGREK